MKFTIVTILTALAATVVAGPIPEEDAQGTATATFHGAADAQFKQAFRLNGKNTRIRMCFLSLLSASWERQEC